MGEIVDTRGTDLFLRPVITPEQKTTLRTYFADIPPKKRAALLVIADLDGHARAMVAAKLGSHWKVAAGAGYTLGEKRPAGYVGLEGIY